MASTLVFARGKDLERSWPFLADRLMARLKELGEVAVVQAEQGVPLGETADLGRAEAIALFGGRLTGACVRGAPYLKAVGGVLDNWEHGHLSVDLLFERDIPIVDATRAWAPSVAECTLGLALCALRRIPQWHLRMASGEPLWDFEYGQFCDAPDFVNGTLGARCAGVIGLGQIGGRVARWCAMLGARVIGYDPFVPKARFEALGAVPVEMDRLVEAAEVVFVTVPPTPSAKGLLSRERIARLRKGALVVVTTRAHAVDMDALRERILADELAGAFDVYDNEPVPADDPLRGRPNVVHTPHIAGRTRDANWLAADVIADDFGRILRGETPEARLSREAMAVRGERTDLPKVEQG